MDTIDTYWMVHRRGRKSGPAVVVHHDMIEAMTEAERLCKQENDTFVVLEAKLVVRPHVEVAWANTGQYLPPIDNCVCSECQSKRQA